MAVFLVLQLLCLALGATGPGVDTAANGFVSAVLGVVALLVSGAACGAARPARTNLRAALLEGAATWGWPGSASSDSTGGASPDRPVPATAQHADTRPTR